MSAPEVPRPTIKHLCRTCRVTQADVDANKVGRPEVVVSPAGTAHFGRDGGDTDCGHDATRDDWWWPL